MDGIITKALKLFVTAIILIAGIICSIELYLMFNVKNAEYGTPITEISESNLETVVKYDIGFIEFEKINNTYTSTLTYAYHEFDGEKNKYEMFFNNQKLNSNQRLGKIESKITKAFYDINGILKAKVTLNIQILFTKSGTTINFISNNTQQELSYFNTYQSIEGATLTVAKEL